MNHIISNHIINHYKETKSFTSILIIHHLPTFSSSQWCMMPSDPKDGTTTSRRSSPLQMPKASAEALSLVELWEMTSDPPVLGNYIYKMYFG